MNSISGDEARPATSGLASSAARNCATDQWSMFSSMLAANFATNTCYTRSRSAFLQLLTCNVMHWTHPPASQSINH